MKKMIFFIMVIANYSLVAYNKMHVSKIQQAIQSGKPVIATGADLRGLGSIFKGKSFSKALLSGASFAKNESDVISAAGTIKVPSQASDLSGSIFSNAELISTNFIGANLQGAIFDGADIAWADFSGCNLKDASFKGAKNMSTAKFCKATLPDGTLLTEETAIGQSFKPYCNK